MGVTRASTAGNKCACMVAFCFKLLRKAKRVEVEKEFRRKATCVPHDLLRCVSLNKYTT